MPIIIPPLDASVTITSLLPFVLPQVPSCPDDVAEFNLLQAAIEFCQRSTAWRAFQGDITTIADTTAYEFELAADQRVAKLLQVTLDGQEVEVVAPELGRQYDTREVTGPYAYGELGAFEIHPAPAAGLVLRTYSALMPSQTATTLPAAFERYFDIIANGAKARLFAMPKADWTDPNEAARMRSEFLSRTATVARAVNRGHAKVQRDPSARFY